MWTEPYMKSANAPKLSVNVVNTTGSMQEQSKYRKYWWYWFPLLWKLKLIYYSKGFVVWAGAPHHSSSNFITLLTYVVLPLFFFFWLFFFLLIIEPSPYFYLGKLSLQTGSINFIQKKLFGKLSLKFLLYFFFFPNIYALEHV